MAATTIGALLDFTKSLVGHLLGAKGKRRGDNPPIKKTDNSTVKPWNGVRLMSFAYRPVSDKEKLPIYDKHPLVVIFPNSKQTARYADNHSLVMDYPNLHWVPDKLLYQFIQMFKTVRNPALAHHDREKILRQMGAMLVNPKLPYRVLRTYRVHNIYGGHLLQERDLQDIDRIMQKFRPLIVANGNEEKRDV
jgi:hypothetical protein